MTNTLLFLLLMIPGTFFLGVNDILIRKVLRRDAMDQQLLLSLDFIGSALILSVPLFIFGIPELKSGFWSAFLIAVVLNVFAQWAWYTAFKKEEASLVAPLRLLTPPLVLLTGYFVLVEQPSLGGILGIFITIGGLWFLLDSEAKFKDVQLLSVLKRPGVLLGLWGAISFAISFPLDKKAVVASSPLFLAALALLVVGIINFIIGYLMHHRDGHFFAGLKDSWRVIIFIPFVHAAGSFLTYAGLNYALAAYAASVKRLWSMWTVLLSGKLLEEKNIFKKVVSIAIVLGGIFIIVFLG